jgi:acetyl-CoA carboxylase beta subunit
MFYILERRKSGNHFDQLGIVVSDSIEAAAAKIEMKIVNAVQPPESGVAYANLENNYSLMEMAEITSSVQIAELQKTASP